MIFRETRIPGAFIVEPERRVDDRGYFARTWDAAEFATHGLDSALVECSISYNREAYTLRGMHLQSAPHQETKLVRCTRGRAFDAIVDLRPSSPSFRQWAAVELSADTSTMIYVPEGCAHGFMTLAADTEIFYQISARYEPSSSGGVRWNDSAFGIKWPAEPRVISDRDRDYPNFAW